MSASARHYLPQTKQVPLARLIVNLEARVREHPERTRMAAMVPATISFCTAAHFRIPFAMTIELSSDASKTAIASIQRYFSENMDEAIGGLAAGALLSFFLKEVGPMVYNKAVADAQARLQERVAELDVEVYEEEGTFWTKRK
jgi:uncharacterized protein (DUF2164 family)